MPKMMKTKGGWSATWKYGVKGTNLSATREQKSTWFLWGYSPRGSPTVLAKVKRGGSGTYDVHDGLQGGKLIASYGGKNALARAKKRAEQLSGAK